MQTPKKNVTSSPMVDDVSFLSPIALREQGTPMQKQIHTPNFLSPFQLSTKSNNEPLTPDIGLTPIRKVEDDDHEFVKPKPRKKERKVAKQLTFAFKTAEEEVICKNLKILITL
jgi:hypothetical protein